MSNDFTFGFDLSVGSSPDDGVGLRSIWPARPLGSSPITGPSQLLRAVPPLCLAVLCPSRCSPLGVLPLATRGPISPISTGRRYRDDRFSTSMPAPATSSRHLYTGHRQGHKQAAPWLRARPRARLGPEDEVQSSVLMPSISFDASAVVHTRSSSRHSPGPVSPGLFPERSPRRLFTDAASGGLDSPPARRARRAKPPSLAQHGSCWRPSTSPSLPFHGHTTSASRAKVAVETHDASATR